MVLFAGAVASAAPQAAVGESGVSQSVRLTASPRALLDLHNARMRLADEMSR